MTGDGMPTLGEVRDYLDLPETVLPTNELARLWQAARTHQLAVVRPEVAEIPEGEWPAALVQALLRRVQRSVAAKSLPLGYLGDTSEAPARLLNYDAVIGELEGPWARVVVA